MPVAVLVGIAEAIQMDVPKRKELQSNLCGTAEQLETGLWESCLMSSHLTQRWECVNSDLLLPCFHHSFNPVQVSQSSQQSKVQKIVMKASKSPPGPFSLMCTFLLYTTSAAEKSLSHPSPLFIIHFRKGIFSFLAPLGRLRAAQAPPQADPSCLLGQAELWMKTAGYGGLL